MICAHTPSSTPPAPPAGSVSPGSAPAGGALEEVDPGPALRLELDAAMERARVLEELAASWRRERDQARSTMEELAASWRRERDQARSTIEEALGELARAGHLLLGDTLAASVRRLVEQTNRTHAAYLSVREEHADAESDLVDARAEIATLRAERDEHDEALHALAQPDERVDEIELDDLAAALDLAGAPKSLSRSARLGWLVARAGVR